MIINKDYCSKCKTTGVKMIKYSKHIMENGDIIQYYRCRDCNSRHHKEWYENDNQQRANMYNRRYLIRKQMDA